MAPKAIRPETEAISCAVCGRRLLQGERAEIYLVGGARRTVCELCTIRANHQGWIRESAGPQLGHRPGGREERRPRFRRLRGRREAAPANGRAGGDGSAPEAAPDQDPASAAMPEGHREPRHVHAVPTSDELKAARALELFNGSEHTRTVAGIARSLGAPAVVIRPDAEQASVVLITVVWELCWYRYEVDLASEGLHSVRLVEQGYELAELAAQDQLPNAAANDRGLLVMADAAR
ncbi:MAG: hypothetical protein ACJ76S_07955 [Solirubrobacteraceae bacterium]